MAQLLVRDLAPELIRHLKVRAARHGRSAEAEHREILKAALLPAPALSLKELLAALPDVGTDRDFSRPRTRTRKVRL